ncbi:MAG: PHP domain-containing protein [Vampirovibrionia bacterium]
MKNYEYSGALHIHTTYSDGTGTIEDVIKQAKKAGLSWIIITDHNSIKGLDEKKEGYYDNVCVLVGQEISPDKANHYLAFDVNELISEKQEPQDFINEVNAKGGFGFIAHPDEQEVRDNSYPALRWQNWDVENFTGIEIWNYMSDWVDTLTRKNKINKFLQPDKSLHGPTLKVTEWWDKLNNDNERVVPAVAGLDVHAFKYNFVGLPLTVFPYDKSFKTIQNSIQIDDFLSRDFETAKKQIYTALKNGNNIMFNNYFGSLEGVVFTATRKDAKNNQIRSAVGEFLEIEKDFILDIEVPQEAQIKLYHNGKLIKDEKTTHLKHRTEEPGSYRFEAYINGYHWIVSNPIKVKKV